MDRHAEMTRAEYGQAYEDGWIRTVRFLLSRGAERDRAADIAQGAWLKGWERLHQLRDDGMVLSWVNTIALNLYRRELYRCEPCLERFRVDVPPEKAGRSTTINWAAIDLARLLYSCGRRDRVLLEAQLIGVTAQEFARKHGATQTAIRSRFLRARQAARRIAEEIRWDFKRLPRVA